ncbi:MAG TPA: response regulator [Saliniramus sp.]|nr:response regulator [Saliniramus sp.]
MTQRPGLLIVDSDVIVRHNLAEYLRDCGYHVVEASTSDEAITFLENEDVSVEAVLADVKAAGSMNGFALAQWVRENRKDTDVVLVGSIEGAMDKASGLCEEGDNLQKPYDPQIVLDRIKQLRAERDRNA